jgi:hypothetical protein
MLLHFGAIPALAVRGGGRRKGGLWNLVSTKRKKARRSGFSAILFHKDAIRATRFVSKEV